MPTGCSFTTRWCCEPLEGGVAAGLPGSIRRLSLLSRPDPTSPGEPACRRACDAGKCGCLFAGGKGARQLVALYNSISKLRRMAQILAPGLDLMWLIEIENDLALVMVPRSKFDRLVLTDVLIEAGLTLVEEASCSPICRPLNALDNIAMD